MSRFQILLHGTGLKLLDGPSERRLGGVYVWRIVEASDEASAVDKAGLAVMQEPEFLCEILNDSLDEIEFVADEIHATSLEPSEGDSGYVFYIDDDGSG